VHPNGANACDRLAGVRAEHCVLRDQRAVEIDREGGDVLGKAGGELD
jgi:hypothetical protein